MKQATCRKFPLLIVAAAGLIIAFITAWANPAAVSADAAQPPEPPASVTLDTEPTSTKVTASWSSVAGATSYKVQWRQRRNVYHPDSQLTVTGITATFDTVLQGAWVVRVAACNTAECGRGTTASATVVINFVNHPAVRVWGEDDTVKVEWDNLPGSYVVSYRSIGESDFRTSGPLSNASYTIPFSDFTAPPIIRVHFNCNSVGKGCALLGRFPDDLAPLPVSDSAPIDSIFPIDFNPLGQNESIVWEECLERSPENEWEKKMRGEVIRRCTTVEIGVPHPLLSEADEEVAGSDGIEIFCRDATRRNSDTWILSTVTTWIEIYWCYNGLDTISRYRVVDAGLEIPSGARNLLGQVYSCGWVSGRSPSNPLVTILEPGKFGGKVEAMIAVGSTVDIFRPSPIPCADARAHMYNLVAGKWGDAMGRTGDWN